MAPKPKTKKKKPNADAAGGAGLDREEMAANYGWALATLKSNKQLWNLFNEAVSNSYTPQRFVAELRNTKWFQKHSESARKYMVLKTSDPAQFNSQIKALSAQIQDQYGQMTGKSLSGAAMTRMADMALRNGWSSEQLSEQLSSSVNWKNAVNSDDLSGTAGQATRAIRQQAAAQGIRLSNDWLGGAVERVATGDDTLEGVNNRIAQLAKKRYRAYADDIDGGMTVAQITEPYRQSMANILELNAGSIDVFDPTIQKALTSVDEKTKQPVQLDMNRFEDNLRRDNRWQYTQNAKETVVGQGNALLKSFGLMS